MIYNFKIIIGGLIFFVSLLALFVFYQSLLPTSTNNSEDILLKIENGASFNEIVDELKANNLIRSGMAFKFYALLSGKAHALKPGVYDLQPSLSAWGIVGILTQGPEDILTVIFPGMTIKEADKRLSSLSIIHRGEIENFPIDALMVKFPWLTKFEKGTIIVSKEKRSLEGFLFPDTYYFEPQSDPKSVIEKFLSNFEVKALPILEGHDNLGEILTIASVLEKEVPDYEDQRIIAGILKKRLNIKMPLQVDASVVYVSCDGEYSDCPAPREDDYKIKSAYNTYFYPGLMPGPISNPSLQALKASLDPEETEYLYYLSDPKTNKTIFAKTLDEQNKNRYKYLLNK